MVQDISEASHNGKSKGKLLVFWIRLTSGRNENLKSTYGNILYPPLSLAQTCWTVLYTAKERKYCRTCTYLCNLYYLAGSVLVDIGARISYFYVSDCVQEFTLK